jgi:hypothetical protein
LKQERGASGGIFAIVYPIVAIFFMQLWGIFLGDMHVQRNSQLSPFKRKKMGISTYREARYLWEYALILTPDGVIGQFCQLSLSRSDDKNDSNP